MPLIHQVRLSNNKTLLIEEANDGVHIATGRPYEGTGKEENCRVPVKYICSFTVQGVLVMTNSGDACRELVTEAGRTKHNLWQWLKLNERLHVAGDYSVVYLTEKRWVAYYLNKEIKGTSSNPPSTSLLDAKNLCEEHWLNRSKHKVFWFPER